MSRKRIWYWIDAPAGLWWVSGEAAPVPANHPSFRRSGSTKRTAWTMKQAVRIASRCPHGTTFVRFMNVRGKRPRRYELQRYTFGGNQ